MYKTVIVVLGLLGLAVGVPMEETFEPGQDFYGPSLDLPIVETRGPQDSYDHKNFEFPMGLLLEESYHLQNNYEDLQDINSYSVPREGSYNPNDFLGSSLGLPIEKSNDLLSQSTRIVGGVDAPEKYMVHMVGLVFGEMVMSFMCGGALITNNAVLTAAHCIEPMISWFDGKLLQSFRGQIGSNSLSHGYYTVRFSHHENHPQWDRFLIKNDIGLLHLTTAIPKDLHVKPIKLSFKWIGGGQRVHVTGWGRLAAGGVLPDRLQLLYKDTISPKQCEEEVRRANAELGPSPPVDTAVEICAMHKEGAGQGMCHGDSGGMLVADDRAVGIVSWGWPCARGFPDVFVRISSYKVWLRRALPKADDFIENED